MAKSKQTDETETETESTEEAAPSPDSRYIMITDPVTGEEVKRVDWIREVFQAETSEGAKDGEYYGNRGAIAKKLSEIQGKKVPYQIVFAATKDLKHIKKPEPVTEETAPSDAAA